MANVSVIQREDGRTTIMFTLEPGETNTHDLLADAILKQIKKHGSWQTALEKLIAAQLKEATVATAVYIHAGRYELEVRTVTTTQRQLRGYNHATDETVASIELPPETKEPPFSAATRYNRG